MMKKLSTLYEKQSMHRGLFSRIKDAWNSESNAKPFPPEPPKKVTPNLGQKPSEDGGVDVTKTLLTTIAGGVIGGPIGAGIGTAVGMKYFRKKK
jgi:hypothetical protein